MFLKTISNKQRNVGYNGVWKVRERKDCKKKEQKTIVEMCT